MTQGVVTIAHKDNVKPRVWRFVRSARAVTAGGMGLEGGGIRRLGLLRDDEGVAVAACVAFLGTGLCAGFATFRTSDMARCNGLGEQ